MKAADNVAKMTKACFACVVWPSLEPEKKIKFWEKREIGREKERGNRGKRIRVRGKGRKKEEEALRINGEGKREKLTAEFQEEEKRSEGGGGQKDGLE